MTFRPDRPEAITVLEVEPIGTAHIDGDIAENEN